MNISHGLDTPPPLIAGTPIVKPTLADRLVSDLAGAGITTYFGVPGGAIEPLFDALARQSKSGEIQVIPTRSEAGAGFAADGYYRQTSRMAVCTGTTGPGISNILTPIMSAHADRMPMLVLTPQVTLSKQGRGALQESSDETYDLPGMFHRCTRYSTTVTHPEQLPHKLARALTLALTPPCGPVHISIPSDILRASPPRGSSVFELSRFTELHPLDLHTVNALEQALLSARSPLLYVGDDAGPAAHRLLELAVATGAAIVSSPAGKRWLGHRDPLYRGVLGFSGHEEARNAALEADLMVAFGPTFDEYSTNGWSVFPDVPIFVVDRHMHHALRIPRTRPVLGETGQVIERLLEKRPRVRHVPACSLPREPNLEEPGPVQPATLMRWLSARLPDPIVVHVDAGNSFSWSTKYLTRRSPDTYRVAMGLASMCWGVGSVIGAAVGSRRRTVCVTGDGAMLMSSLELTVAVEQRLPVTYVILNDSCLGMVRHGQRLGGAEPIAFEIPPVRFDRLAEACGARGLRIESARELALIAEDWLCSNDSGPCVIDVVIDRTAVPPMADRVIGLAAGLPR